ncbi:Obp56h.2 family protein [Megaselia abdita]
MKYQLILIVATVLGAALAEDLILQEHPELMKCAKEVGLDVNDKNAKQTKEFKCLFKCAFETEGLLKDGTFVADKIISSLQSDTQMDKNGKEQAVKKVPKCMDQVKRQVDLCEKSFGLYDCIFNN